MITSLFVQLVAYPIVYKQEMTGVLIATKLFYAFLLLSCMAAFNLAIMQIVKSRSRLARLMLENENLLNKMHEGIIVVS